MMNTLFHKVWNAHAVRTLPSGQTQLFVGLHLIHEVTSPQAFDMVRQHGWGVPFPELTFATVGPATGPHIAFETLKRRANVDVTFVPFNGTSTSINAVMGGHVSVAMGDFRDVSAYFSRLSTSISDTTVQ